MQLPLHTCVSMDSIRYVLAVLVWATFPPTILFWILTHLFVNQWRRSGGPAPTYLVLLPTCLLLFGVLLRWNPVAGTDLGMNWSLFAAGSAIWMGSWALERNVRAHMDFRMLAGVRELEWGSKVLQLPTIDDYIGDRVDDQSVGSEVDPAATGESEDEEDPYAPLPPPPHLGEGPDVLVQNGPFAVVRHPRAMATAIGLWGWAMMSNYSTSYLMAGLYLVGLAVAIQLEDRELRDRFGEEWKAYAAEVPAVFPRRGTKP